VDKIKQERSPEPTSGAEKKSLSLIETACREENSCFALPGEKSPSPLPVQGKIQVNC